MLLSFAHHQVDKDLVLDTQLKALWFLHATLLVARTVILSELEVLGIVIDVFRYQLRVARNLLDVDFNIDGHHLVNFFVVEDFTLVNSQYSLDVQKYRVSYILGIALPFKVIFKLIIGVFNVVKD